MKTLMTPLAVMSVSLRVSGSMDQIFTPSDEGLRQAATARSVGLPSRGKL